MRREWNVFRFLRAAKAKWAVEIRFVDAYGGKPPDPIKRFEDEDMMTVLALCQIGSGMIEYDGRRAYVYKPICDPIRRRLVYTVELYEKVAP